MLRKQCSCVTKTDKGENYEGRRDVKKGTVYLVILFVRVDLLKIGTVVTLNNKDIERYIKCAQARSVASLYSCANLACHLTLPPPPPLLNNQLSLQHCSHRNNTHLGLVYGHTPFPHQPQIQWGGDKIL